MVHERSVYADASPLIALARIDRLDLLAILPLPIRATSAVWEEATGEAERPGAARLIELEKAGRLRIVDEGDPQEFPHLDAGEASALAAARAAGGALLIDERKARHLLESDPRLKDSVPYLTTIALVVLAKRRGLVDRVRPVLDQLREQGFRLGDKAYEDALQAARE